MKYISVSAAAEKWELTERRVQEMCKNGKVSGANKVGRVWVIPHNAAKPIDKRYKEHKLEDEVQSGFLIPAPRQTPFLIHSDLYNTPGSAQSVIDSFSKWPETQRIIKAQFNYQQGNVDRIYGDVKYFLNAHKGFYSAINSGMLLAFTAMWEGDINLWKRARQQIFSVKCKTESEKKQILFWLAVVDGAIYDVRDFPEWFTEGNFEYLSKDSFPTARFMYAKYLFVLAHDIASGKLKFHSVKDLGMMKALPYILEPMISQAKVEKTLILEGYLHLMAAVVYHNFGEDNKAIRHLDAAIEICLPDRLYGVLAEYRTQLDNLLDDRLALFDQAAVSSVKELHKRRRIGWVKLHNDLLKRSVSNSLTVREREVAKLAAFGLSNSEIADRLNIELSSVKRYIFSAMNKVGVNKRGELGQYI